MKKYKYLILIITCSLLFALCFVKKEKKVVSDFSIDEVKYSQLKNWKKDKIDDFLIAYLRSCEEVGTEYFELIDYAVLEINRNDYLNHCHHIKNLPKSEVKEYIENNFTPYSVKYKNNPNGIFTGYYEASINASYEKTDKYKYPIYGRPNDIVKLNLNNFDDSLPNVNIVGRVKDNRLVHYFDRREIDIENKIDANVILWADSLIDIFIMQIQGSAVATLPDGTTQRIGYADNNGHKFVGIGSIMKEKGLLEPGKASMGHIKEWLENHPKKALEIMAENPRYIFFRLNNRKGAIGAEGVPLVAKRSIAVDSKYIPMGSVMWLETKDPDGNDLDRLVMAQDIGAAIKGGIRGDFFWGYGDEAFYNAGRMKSVGKYYILLPKE